MKMQEKRRGEPQRSAWRRHLPMLAVIVLALSVLAIIPIAGAIDAPVADDAAMTGQEARQASSQASSVSRAAITALDALESAPDGEAAQLMSQEGSDTSSEATGEGDSGSPADVDACKRVVTYQVYNGWWDGESAGSDPVTQEVILRDADGNPDENGTAVLEPPAVGNSPAPDYAAGAWDIDPALMTFTKDSPTTYIYTYDARDNSTCSYTIEYYFDDVLAEGLSKTYEARAGETVSPSSDDLMPTIEYGSVQYALIGEMQDYSLEVGPDSANNFIKVRYGKDEIGPENGPMVSQTDTR